MWCVCRLNVRMEISETTRRPFPVRRAGKWRNECRLFEHTIIGYVIGTRCNPDYASCDCPIIPNVQRVHRVNRPFFSSEDSDPNLGFQTFPIIFHLPAAPSAPDYDRNEILGRMICDELTIERCGVIAVKTSARRFRKQRGDPFRSDGRASGETSVVSLNTL